MSVNMQGFHSVSSPNISADGRGDYASLVAANPYSGQSYKQSPWQNFLSSLGFRTQADAWKENMSVQAAEYDAALKQKQFDNEYNDPSAMAARMRSAGLNPDLQGLGDVAEAASMGDDPSTPMQSTGDEVRLLDAANFIMSAVTSGVGLAKQFGELRALGIANDAGEIQNLSGAANLGKWISEQFNLNPAENGDVDPGSVLKDHLIGLDRSYSRYIPKRLRGAFRSSIFDFGQSLNAQADAWNKSEKRNDSKLKVARQVESKYFGDGSFASMRVVNKGLVKLSDALSEVILGRQNAEQSFNKDYFDNLSGDEKAASENAVASNTRIYNENLDPVAKADAENASNEFVGQQRSIDTIINSSISDIVHDLKRLADRGDFFAQSMLFSFAIARMSSFQIGPKGVKFGLNPQ